ncbi:hypothetical protein GCM10010251_80280 [Streptomyces aurantiogriseus]|uniref:Uncharacterized protein n=1 Tax=Streptomyces aurantiogriseus TaxID=66870 RepID=A0A918FLK5_9ACTN|nr:hypothetical protein GCM10010251_80280 [Streptomyces aurantiogriseus]
MAVDQPGHRDLAAGVEPLHRGDSGGFGGGDDGVDEAVPYDDGGVLEERDALLLAVSYVSTGHARPFLPLMPLMPLMPFVPSVPFVHEDGAVGDDEVGGAR